jgi:putative membrane protein
MEKQEANKFFYKVFCGFLLGISIVAPGISGSIIAVMLGIYGDLIAITANPFKNLKKNIIYIIPLGIGAAISFILFIFIFEALFKYHETATFVLFIALILGSLPTVWRSAQKIERKIRPIHIIIALIAMSISLTMGIIERSGIVAGANDSNIIYISIVGFIAGLVSMVPGMSISLILMLFGVYQTLLTATKSLDIWTMAPVGLCFVAGLIILSRGIKHVFDHHEKVGYFAVMGFMVGSLYSIIPTVPKDMPEWILSVAMFAIGILLSILFVYLGKKLNIEKIQEDSQST